jgi:hypothetical protein
MNDTTTSRRATAYAVAALFAIVAAAVPAPGSAESTSGHAPGAAVLAQAATPGNPPPGAGAPAALPAPIVTWNFATPQDKGGEAWVAERGRMTFADGETRLQPDTNRRVALLSPPGLPEAAKAAETFTVGVDGTGVQRIRIQARRDARGGWITIADASGEALRETADGYVVKRKGGARTAPIERLRIELDFRTSNPRVLQRIAVR